MATYYFTYGIGDTKSTKQDYQCGCTEVEAENSLIALKAYAESHLQRHRWSARTAVARATTC